MILNLFFWVFILIKVKGYFRGNVVSVGCTYFLVLSFLMIINVVFAIIFFRYIFDWLITWGSWKQPQYITLKKAWWLKTPLEQIINKLEKSTLMCCDFGGPWTVALLACVAPWANYSGWLPEPCHLPATCRPGQLPCHSYLNLLLAMNIRW